MKTDDNFDGYSNDQFEHLMRDTQDLRISPPLHDYRPVVRARSGEPSYFDDPSEHLGELPAPEVQIEQAWEEIRRARVILYGAILVVACAVSAIAGIVIGLLNGHGGR